ncbi:MAG: radical SAM protein, partial [Thermomicrobiales bacterium]
MRSSDTGRNAGEQPAIVHVVRKGRGAVTNIPHRYEAVERAVDGDALDAVLLESEDADPVPLATSVSMETARSLITYNDSPDIPFDRSINPYRGCEHGCVYCYARPTHSYLNLSPGLDFETKLVAKQNAVEALLRDLSAPSYRPDILALGTVTDCYQPIERNLKLTRGIIEVLASCRHPFGIVTKSSLIERDIDLLAPLAADGLAEAFISVTSLDSGLSRTLEPRAASPVRRLRAIETLSRAGIRVHVNVAPIIPFINEPE